MKREFFCRKKQKLKSYIAVSVCCISFFGAICGNAIVGNAATVGTVNTGNGNLNIRGGPGTTYEIVGTVAKNAKVTILGEKDGWYQVQCDGKEGYVLKEYITDVQETEVEEVDAAYTAELVKQGFPESYATMLSALHVKYPNWVFEPVITGLEWAKVLEEESKLGRNLVQASNNDAQKSTAKGAYNWKTNTWNGFDGAGWVCASTEMIAYCMDPRNFLTEENIYQFATSDYKEYQKAAGVKALAKDSFLAKKYTDTDGKKKSYPKTFVEVGKAVGVSPYHLAARCMQEQGRDGSGRSISGTVSGYENYFNYFNVGAYPSNGLNSMQNGLKYAKSKGWNTRYASILGGAEVVGNSYVKKGQNTVYFEKFNVVNTVSGLYSHQYMTNVQAAISEGQHAKKAYTDDEAAVVFRIPIYKNMPETACPLPESGNPNNWIKSLKVEGYSLTPGFKPGKTEYSLIVEDEVDSVTIHAQTVASGSSVSGAGTIKLEYGTNKVQINCTAENQTVRTYTLNIVRSQAEQTEAAKGDLNKDGVISLNDIVAVKRHILGIQKLEGELLKLGDLDGDGEIGLSDYVKMKRHILGYE